MSNILSTIGNIALGGLSSVLSNVRSKKAVDEQRKEAAINRKWLEEQSTTAYERERQLQEDNRNWNSELSVMSRLKSAGLNPDLMYGSSSPSVLNSSGSVSSPTSSASDVASPLLSSQTPVEGYFASLLANKTVAETDKINADTSKVKGEITSIDLDNIVKSATTGAKIEQENLSVNLSKSVLSLNEQQRSNLVQQLNNLKTANDQINASIDELKASSRNLDANTFVTRLNAYLDGEKFDLECKRFAQEVKESNSRINLSAAESKEILTLLLEKKLNIQTQTRKLANESVNTSLLKDNIIIQGRQLEFDYKQNTKYDDVQRVMQLVESGSSSVSNIIRAIKGVR